MMFEEIENMFISCRQISDCRLPDAKMAHEGSIAFGNENISYRLFTCSASDSQFFICLSKYPWFLFK